MTSGSATASTALSSPLVSSALEMAVRLRCVVYHTMTTISTPLRGGRAAVGWVGGCAARCTAGWAERAGCRDDAAASPAPAAAAAHACTCPAPQPSPGSASRSARA